MSAVAHESAPSPRVTVVIKTLNEERRIDAAIESTLVALAPVGGEVIVADSGSTDCTVERARCHPVTIVQLQDPAEQRCGIGPQLGYQRARGEFVYVLDGDMELDPGFLVAALAAMDADPRLGGVAGLVEEQSEASYQFRGRRRRAREGVARDCEWLDMGGLYRVEALRDVSYLSNRNLHSCEEMELGLRLCAAGWSLRRLASRGALHHGRPEGTWPLLVRRWRSRYLDGPGELLRAASGRPYLWRVVQTHWYLFLALALWLGWAASLLLLPVAPWLALLMLAATAGLTGWRALRLHDVRDALLGQLVWQVSALAMLRGLLARPRDPVEPVRYIVLREAQARADAGLSNAGRL